MNESGKNTVDGFCLIFSMYAKHIFHRFKLKKVTNF